MGITPQEAISALPGTGALVGRPIRLRGAVLAGPCLLVLLLARQVAPRADGFGTHRDLGLPVCSVLAETGWPCPTCGLTTSVSAMAHGRFDRAVAAHPFGPVVFGAILLLAAAGGAEWVTGRDILGPFKPRLWWALAAVAGVTAGWAVKLVVGALNGELPLR